MSLSRRMSASSSHKLPVWVINPDWFTQLGNDTGRVNRLCSRVVSRMYSVMHRRRTINKPLRPKNGEQVST